LALKIQKIHGPCSALLVGVKTLQNSKQIFQEMDSAPSHWEQTSRYEWWQRPRGLTAALSCTSWYS